MSNSTTIQLIGAAITVSFLIVIVRMVRQRKLRAKYSFIWLLVGLSIVAITAIPGLLDWFSAQVGIAYPPAFLFLCALLFLMFLAVHFSWEISRLEDRTRTLAEEVGMANEELHELRAELRTRFIQK